MNFLRALGIGQSGPVPGLQVQFIDEKERGCCWQSESSVNEKQLFQTSRTLHAQNNVVPWTMRPALRPLEQIQHGTGGGHSSSGVDLVAAAQAAAVALAEELGEGSCDAAAEATLPRASEGKVSNGYDETSSQLVTVFTLNVSHLPGSNAKPADVKALAYNAVKKAKACSMLPGSLRVIEATTTAVPSHPGGGGPSGSEPDSLYIMTEPCIPLTTLLSSPAARRLLTGNDAGIAEVRARLRSIRKGAEGDSADRLNDENADDEEEELNDKLWQQSVALGLRSIASTLQALHGHGQSHNNVHTDSIYVTRSGEWKLFGYELCFTASDNTNPINTIVSRSISQLVPEHRRTGFDAAAGTGSVASYDSWCFGCLLYYIFGMTPQYVAMKARGFDQDTRGKSTHAEEAFTKVLLGSTVSDVKSCRTLPRSLQPLLLSLISNNVKNRPSMGKMLGENSFFNVDEPADDDDDGPKARQHGSKGLQNADYALLAGKISTLPLLDVADREQLYLALSSAVQNGKIPLAASVRQILPILLQALSYGAGTATVLKPLLSIGLLLSCQRRAFNNHLGPFLVALFSSSDVFTRCRLLAAAPQFLLLLSPLLLAKYIWCPYSDGFQHNRVEVREGTVRALPWVGIVLASAATQKDPLSAGPETKPGRSDRAGPEKKSDAPPAAVQNPAGNSDSGASGIAAGLSSWIGSLTGGPGTTAGSSSLFSSSTNSRNLSERAAQLLETEVPKYISLLQQDSEGVVRANATICLSFLAPYYLYDFAYVQTSALLNNVGRSDGVGVSSSFHQLNHITLRRYLDTIKVDERGYNLPCSLLSLRRRNNTNVVANEDINKGPEDTVADNSSCTSHNENRGNAKILVNGFGRMLRDPFLPSKIAALRGLLNTLEVAPFALDSTGHCNPNSLPSVIDQFNGILLCPYTCGQLSELLLPAVATCCNYGLGGGYTYHNQISSDSATGYSLEDVRRLAVAVIKGITIKIEGYTQYDLYRRHGVLPPAPSEELIRSYNRHNYSIIAAGPSATGWPPAGGSAKDGGSPAFFGTPRDLAPSLPKPTTANNPVSAGSSLPNHNASTTSTLPFHTAQDLGKDRGHATAWDEDDGFGSDADSKTARPPSAVAAPATTNVHKPSRALAAKAHGAEDAATNDGTSAAAEDCANAPKRPGGMKLGAKKLGLGLSKRMD